ncbi:Aste57867_19393 [Aphanomyces stellatus]|uniref:Aste57867_19393 protein n=1 Tax=Aphanomyces stellatus TaxID=120398 RepID=A0A485LCL5_9STRA|nr:hypothetical protein As57867_019329 [Aphanomyces stellatus]VFT96107.1 Aste57867_19393 [Aphanomyces stellatus]
MCVLINGQIAQELRRGKSVIRSFLASPETYGTAKRQGRPRKLSPETERQILDVGWANEMNAREVIDHLHLDGVNVRQVQRLFQADKRLNTSATPMPSTSLLSLCGDVGEERADDMEHLSMLDI